MKRRCEHARSLFVRAGNAGCAVAVDTRPKSIPGKKNKNTRKQTKIQLKKASWKDQKVA